MNVAIFGGTFDPVHRGHLAVARAAAARFKLGKIYFVPADIPPHKQKQPLTPYYHRFAMVALAVAGEKNFIPSLLEAPEIIQSEGKLASYSIDTVRRFKQTMKKSDRLFFLIGIDAFLDIGKWRSPVELMHECEFIVASRPKFSLTDVAKALPESMRPKDDVARLFQKSGAHGSLVLPETTIHLLDGVEEPISATQIRTAAGSGKKLEALVGKGVAEYIRKEGLYQKGAQVLPDLKVQRELMKQEREAKKHRAGLHIIAGKKYTQG
jgi:nicotinate-nucleotide adenylyltransferase